MKWIKVNKLKRIIPKKRYLFLASIIIYLSLKLYVSQTPSKEDDNLPEEFKDSACNMLILSSSDDQEDQL